MLFELNSADKMGQFLVTVGFSVISTMSDCFATSSTVSYFLIEGSTVSYFLTGGSAVSYFLTGGSTASHLPSDDSTALLTMSSDLMSVPQGVFYTSYAGTGNTGYIGMS